MSITSIPSPPAPSARDLAHFHSIPWCRALLSDASFSLLPTPSRSPQHERQQQQHRQPRMHTFMSETLNTGQTIRAWLSQARVPREPRSPIISEVRALLDLGSGVNGHQDVCHGGFVAVVLDEVTGLLLVANEMRERERDTQGLVVEDADGQGEREQEGGAGRESFRGPVMTASLAVRYERPVPTPGVVVARAVLGRVEGRKRFVTGTVEDGEGKVYARAEGVFVQLKEKL